MRLTLTQIVGFDPFPKQQRWMETVRMNNIPSIELEDNQQACNACGGLFEVLPEDNTDPANPTCPGGCVRLMCWTPRCKFMARVFIDQGRADGFKPVSCVMHSLGRVIAGRIVRNG